MSGILAAEGGKIPVPFRTLETNALWIILGISLVALVVAYFLVKQVMSAPQGTPKMIEIAKAIQEGSAAYLRRQFMTVGAFVVALGVLLFFILPAPLACIQGVGTAAKLIPLNAAGQCVGGTVLHPAWVIRLGRSLAFVLGAGFSALTGFAGMSLAVRANVRVANAARESGLRRALTIAFRAGGVAGMFTVGLGLLGAVVILLLFKEDAPDVLVGFGFGGALLAMFMRVGGGIFTKAADVGADLVGKVEQDIPEDDPRNAATIADNVGDNVGDCAGMAADLFESYEVTLVAAIILGAAAFIAKGPAAAIIGVTFPLFVRAIGVVTSIVGIYMVAPRSENEHGMRAINRGFFVSAALSAVAVLAVAHWYAHNVRMFFAVLIGLALSAVIQVLTQHFTDTTRAPVQEIAKASNTGAATTILSGFSVGMESTVWALLAVAAAIMGAFLLGHGIDEKLYYIALSGMGMLTTVGVIVSMDTYGPISDNAHGIAEMSGGLGERADEIMAGLDAVGNTTKAITKGMAIATAVIAATSLFGSFREIVIGELSKAGKAVLDFPIRIDHPDVLVGLLIGGAVSFLFASLAIRAVGRAAGQIVQVVRKQFRIPGVMEGTVKPDYAQVVDICTKRSLRELVTPGLLAILTPVIVGFALKAEALGAFLAGVILTGQLLAVMLSNAGGAWDNAKKFVEEGNYGGKGSEQHKATVIGDTVGDPFKDTAGPALNPLIKVMNLVSLLTVPVIVHLQKNTGARVAVVVVGVAILAVSIAYSKKQRPEDEMIAEPAPVPVEAAPPAPPAKASAKTTTKTRSTTKR
ncbi:MAG: sodium-translocating pyrophosphatase [Actinobacteria bacterium]|nr:MAG: sodium-translocating pyrophosphatase [Actinomycetota bacterium]